MQTTDTPATSQQLSELTARLDQAGVSYQILVHEHNLASADDGVEKGLGDLASMAPTFILHTEAGYLAAIVRGDSRLSYKKIKQHLRLKNVSLASPAEVLQLTGSEVGYVALINPHIPTIVDARLLEKEVVYGGSGEKNHTLKIHPQAVAALNQAQIFDFTELKDPPQL